MAEPAKPDEPREMTPADRRRVFRAVDENWDEANARYCGAETDDTLGKKLGVPRAWVASVREQAFGPLGHNDEMREVEAALGKVLKAAQEAGGSALRVAAEAEAIEVEVKALAKRLAAIEKSVGPRR